jgi:hypothetical protein
MAWVLIATHIRKRPECHHTAYPHVHKACKLESDWCIERGICYFTWKKNCLSFDFTNSRRNVRLWKYSPFFSPFRCRKVLAYVARWANNNWSRSPLDLVEVWLDSTLRLLRLLLQQDPGRLQPAWLPYEILCTKACCTHKSFTPCKSLDNIEIRRDTQWHMIVWNDLPCCSHLLSCSSWPRAKSEQG